MLRSSYLPDLMGDLNWQRMAFMEPCPQAWRWLADCQIFPGDQPSCLMCIQSWECSITTLGWKNIARFVVCIEGNYTFVFLMGKGGNGALCFPSAVFFYSIPLFLPSNCFFSAYFICALIGAFLWKFYLDWQKVIENWASIEDGCLSSLFMLS